MPNPRLKFSARQEHIDNGQQCHGQKCALALAIKEAIGAEEIGVDPLGIAIGENNAGIPAGYYNCPDEMDEFIQNFDDDKSSVSPRDFDCELISQEDDDDYLDDDDDWCGEDDDEDDWLGEDDDEDDWLGEDD